MGRCQIQPSASPLLLLYVHRSPSRQSSTVIQPRQRHALSPFAYLIPLISVLVGLAVADLATSLHRLLRARRRVEWDWLPLVAAFLAVLSVLDLWWSLYGARETASWTFVGFLPLAAMLVVLFLINAAALPDDVPSDGLDLQAFYDSNGSYFWFLYAIYVFMAIANNIGRRVADGLPEGAGLVSVLVGSGANLVVFGLYVALALVRNRPFHMVTVVVLLAFYIFQWSQRSIGAV